MMKPLKLSGGALNLPNLETNDCPLPYLQIHAARIVQSPQADSSEFLHSLVLLIFQRLLRSPVGDRLHLKVAVASSRSTGPTKPQSRWPPLSEVHSSRCRSRPTRGQRPPGLDAWIWTSYRNRKLRRRPSPPNRDHQAFAASTNLNPESATSRTPRIVSQSVRTLSHSCIRKP